MYPWAVAYRDYTEKFGSWTIFGSMFSFVAILMVGFVYALKKGALDWKR
jgi:NADH-quinone oxidoreductase subunit A